MTLLKHELRQGRAALLIWAGCVGGLVALCVFLFPSMKGQLDQVGEVFASMGSFTAAFGMDRLSFGTLIGFYAIECGNILSLGGAFFAALCGVGMLCKEERDHTAEFLLTQPVSRARIVGEKLLAVLAQVAALDLAVFALAVASIAAIGESVPWKELGLLHLAYLLLQLELAGICFGISAFVRRAGAGIGLGLAALLYFLNLAANIADEAAFLRFLTPFAYCEAADILAEGRLDGPLVAIGAALTLAGVAAAWLRYTTKDIR